jgi:hypothetical protein
LLKIDELSLLESYPDVGVMEATEPRRWSDELGECRGSLLAEAIEEVG